MPASFIFNQVLSSFLNLEECVTLYQTERRSGKRRTIKILSNRKLKLLCGELNCLSLPMHIRGPSPNGRYV